MVSDNYVWRGRALWIAIGTITPVLLIESGGGAPAVADGGVGEERGRMEMRRGDSGDGIANRGGGRRGRVGWVWVVALVAAVVVAGCTGQKITQKGSGATPGPINITGTVYKIDNNGFFLNSDDPVPYFLTPQIQTNNVYIYTSHPILRGPKSMPNITVGMRLKIYDSLLVFKPEENETVKPADTDLEYKEGALCFITRSSIENIN